MKKETGTVIKMPSNRTWKQERKVELKEFEDRLRKDNLISIFKVIGIAIGSLTIGIVLIYLTALIPELVHNTLGVPLQP